MAIQELLSVAIIFSLIIFGAIQRKVFLAIFVICIFINSLSLHLVNQHYIFALNNQTYIPFCLNLDTMKEEHIYKFPGGSIPHFWSLLRFISTQTLYLLMVIGFAYKRHYFLATFFTLKIVFLVVAQMFRNGTDCAYYQQHEIERSDLSEDFERFC